MWNPIKIEFENLFSHKKSEYEFKNNKCVLVFGENKTDRSMENNGAGKTTLFEAICIALTNESLRNIKKENFINRDAEFCEINFELENLVQKKTLKIIRKFFRGNKTSIVQIFENGIQNTQIVSALEANKRILNLLQISREDLLRYYIISQDNHYTFFTASDSEKKEIMNRITSADVINSVIEELTEKARDKQKIFDDFNIEIEKLTEKSFTLEEQKRELLESDDLKNEIEKLNQKIHDCNEEISLNKEKIKEFQDQEDEIKNILEKIHVDDISSLKEICNKNIKELEKIDNSEIELKRVRKNIESELSDSIKCPKCGYEFIEKSDLGLTVETAQELLKESKKESEKNLKRKEEISQKIEELKEQINKVEEKIEKQEELEYKQKRIKNSKDFALSENESLKNEIKQYKQKIESLKTDNENNVIIQKIEQKIKDCNEEIRKKQEELKPVEKELQLIKFWQFNMGKSGFMTYLANRSIKIIEGITNSYLRKFKTDISVLINGFKVLKSGEVREKIDIFVSNDGITAENFMSKSGGERGRVMLAGILGIQHLINLSSNGGGLNLLVLDECFSGMDSRGQENIIKILENMGITILIITQNVSESFNVENTLKVVKENGVSRYI